ncbi:MAG: hypothetical protein CR986_07930 [Ignavibacteriae bacterium]|nr:MAG: hypothetical protein CR986_07930 [Ignavibacteriota bacterium]
MGGKASMLMVLGFSMIFLVFGSNFNNLSTRAVENDSDYFKKSTAHSIAVSAANIATNKLFLDKTWDEGYINEPFNGGKFNVYVTNKLGSSAKIKVCHNKGKYNQKVISIPPSQLAVHLAHGDQVGGCPGASSGDSVVTVFAEGIYLGDTASVCVKLARKSFAKYGNFYERMSGAIPATGDVFDGPFHVNDYLNTYGTPEFLGEVTCLKGLKKYLPKIDPIFRDTFTSGLNEPRPLDTLGMKTAALSGGIIIKDTSGGNLPIDVEITFNDKLVEYRTKIKDGHSHWSPKKTTNLDAINGMMYVEKGNVFVKGQVDGAATIVATKLNKSGYGNIYQTDNLTYKDNVVANPNSNNMLGLVAEENIRLQYNNRTRFNDITTHATMFSYNGNVGPDNLLMKNGGHLADWNILGGITAHNVRGTAYYRPDGTPYKGYRLRHIYDKRFEFKTPPYFPHTKNLNVVSWFE